MTINKLTEKVKGLDEFNKINEIIDTLNNGVTITTDTELNESSPNPVQNAVITSALNLKQDILTAGAGISISDNIISTNNYSYYALCPAITPLEGVATWTVTHNLGTQNIAVSLYADGDEVGKNVDIISDNSITVSFPSTSNVAAEEYSIIVLAIGGTYTQPQVDPDLLSKNIFTVKLDGTGDFTSAIEAFNYLRNKYSTKPIVLQFGEGIFEINQTISLDKYYYTGINHLIIEGVSDTLSILQLNRESVGYLFDCKFGMDIRFHNIQFKRASSCNQLCNGISALYGAHITYDNITFDGFNISILSQANSGVNLMGNITISNFNIGLCAEVGFIASSWGTVLNFRNDSNKGTAFIVSYGGQIHITGENTVNYTNVQTKCNVTPGASTLGGWVTGITI